MPSRISIVCALGGFAWAAGLAFGIAQIWTYQSTPGAPAYAPIMWPSGTHVSRIDGLPTLVVLIHPKCPCSRASLGELAKLMSTCQGKVRATVLMSRPGTMAAGWERTDLWESAAALQGVSVFTDVDGQEARRFGAQTSGQTLLFAADGRVSFSGGITESRGHSGDNDGCSLIASLVLHGAVLAPTARTPVYGCPLFDPTSTFQKEGTSACRSK